MSEGFAWRVAGYLDEDRAPSIEISPELDGMYDTAEYLSGVGEALIELGVMLLKYNDDALEAAEPKRRPSPKPRSSPKHEAPPVRAVETGGYL